MTKWELEKKARQKASSIARRYGLVVLSTHCSRDIPPTTYRIETVVPETGCRLTVMGYAWERIGRDGHPSRRKTARSTTGFDGNGTSHIVPIRESSPALETAIDESCETDAPAPPARE